MRRLSPRISRLEGPPVHSGQQHTHVHRFTPVCARRQECAKVHSYFPGFPHAARKPMSQRRVRCGQHSSFSTRYGCSRRIHKGLRDFCGMECGRCGLEAAHNSSMGKRLHAGAVRHLDSGRQNATKKPPARHVSDNARGAKGLTHPAEQTAGITGDSTRCMPLPAGSAGPPASRRSDTATSPNPASRTARRCAPPRAAHGSA